MAPESYASCTFLLRMSLSSVLDLKEILSPTLDLNQDFRPLKDAPRDYFGYWRLRQLLDIS